MLALQKPRCLLDELERLAEARKITDFRFPVDVDSLPAEERETARLLKKVLDNFRGAAEYDLTRYRLTGESLGVGYWDMTLQGGDAANPDNPFIWSPELRRLLGYPHHPGEGDFPDTLANWLEHLHPDDRDEAVEAFVAHIADTTGKTQFVAEYRLRKTNGGYMAARAFGTALRDSAGVPIRIAGAVEEITEAAVMRSTLICREKTLDILNRVALVLLARKEESFAGAMSEGIDLIAGIADIDRMSIFRNSEKPDGRYLSQIYRWRNDTNGTVDVWKELNDVPYARIVPQLEPVLASGKSIGGHVNSLPGCEAFKRFGCETILAIPVFDDGKFWGAALFERLNDKTFTEQETEVLRSASFMLSNAVIRNEEAAMVRQADEQSRLMLDAAPFAVIMWSKNLDLLDCSQTTLEVFGFSTKGAMKEGFWALAPEYQPCGRRSVDVLAEEVKKTFETGYTRLEWTHMSTGGEVLLFDVIAKRIKYKGDYAIMLYTRDIREEKKMLAALKARDEMLVAQAETVRQANEQVQLMLDAAPFAVTMWDKNFKVIDCSKSAADIFGVSSKQELLERLMDFVPEYQPCGRPSLDVLAEAGIGAFQTGSGRMEWTHHTASGEPIVFEATAVRVKYHNEYALMLYTRDIREEKKMLAALKARDEMLVAQAEAVRQANEQVQLMLDAAPFAVTMWDKNFRVVDCSQTALDVFGFSSKQDLIEHFVDTAPEFQPCGRSSLDVLAEAAAEAFQKGSCSLEWTGPIAGGETAVFEDTAVRVKYRNEYALMLYSRDIREEKKMLAGLKARDEMLVAQAETIRQANEQIQTMLDAIPVSITIWNRERNVIDCSQYAVDLFGYSDKQELIEQLSGHAPEYQPCGKKSAEKLAESNVKAFQTGYDHLEWTQLTTGGEPIALDAQAIRIKHRGDYALMLFSRDIREEKRMLANLTERDEMLEAQAHWYKSLLDGIPVPIRVTDADMNLTFTNTASEHVFGGNREELVGRHCSVLNCAICNTENCSVVRAKQGQKQTYFKRGAMSYKIDAEIIRDKAGETIGYLEVLHDITEVENLARRQADAANEAKSAFLAQMSHEMRTPLSAVIGLSELVLENGGLNPDNEVYLDKIYNAGSTLLSIVNDILDISKIEAGKFEIVPQEYDVPSLINDTITQNLLRIHSKPVQFTLNISENAPMRLHGDDIRVKQILSNLLSNAFKYTDEGKVELRIDYEQDGNSVWTTFRVSDTGIGIKPEDIRRLFTDYARFDGETNRKTGGTGLGLSITKRLAELMDGAVTAESEYGKGSVFTAKIRQRIAGESVIGREMAEHLRNFRYTTSKRRSGAQLHRVRIPYARVLVVDDNKTNLDIAQGLMRPYGMEVDCVTSGQAAIDLIREEKNKYGAVFMDHMMPGMDGVETVRIIRKEIGSEYAKTVPIIALTANALAGNRERFISQGFNAFVSKPIDIFRLDEVIRRWIWDKTKDDSLDGSRVFVERRKRQGRRSGGDRRAGERRSTAPVPAFSEGIEGLDWIKGLELFGGADSLRQVLRSFAVNTRPLLDSMCEPGEESLPQYAITVHGIKSSGRGIGAGALGDMAESLEFAAKDGNLEFVRLHNPAFLAAAQKLIADIETLLDKNVRAAAKPQKERPGGAVLKRLCAACKDFNMDEIEAAMREIESCEYTAGGGLAAWLSENVAQLNYAQVIEKITEVTKNVSSEA